MNNESNLYDIWFSRRICSEIMFIGKKGNSVVIITQLGSIKYFRSFFDTNPVTWELENNATIRDVIFVEDAAFILRGK